ncbi:MAG: hypothetical protein OXD33_07685, partial [Rhodobacteraceae bacterium]|nr:hypothetical protein [Paracoccaceae bacterium]
GESRCVMPSAKNNWNEIPYTSVNCCKDRRRGHQGRFVRITGLDFIVRAKSLLVGSRTVGR